MEHAHFSVSAQNHKCMHVSMYFLHLVLSFPSQILVVNVNDRDTPSKSAYQKEMCLTKHLVLLHMNFDSSTGWL